MNIGKLNTASNNLSLLVRPTFPVFPSNLPDRFQQNLKTAERVRDSHSTPLRKIANAPSIHRSESHPGPASIKNNGIRKAV